MLSQTKYLLLLMRKIKYSALHHNVNIFPRLPFLLNQLNFLVKSMLSQTKYNILTRKNEHSAKVHCTGG